MPIATKRIYPEALIQPSAYCRFFFLCEQGSGDMETKVPGGLPAVKNPGFADGTLWGSAGYATVGGTVGNYCILPASQHDVSLATHTLVYTLRVKKVAAAKPGADQYIVSSYTPGSVPGGVIIAARSDGGIRMFFNSTDDSTSGVSSTANALTDGTTATERTCVFIAPRVASGASFLLGLDGLPNATSPVGVVAGKSLAGGNTMRIGQGQAGSAIDSYRIAAFGLYALPIDASALNEWQINDWVWRNPGAPIPDWVFA